MIKVKIFILILGCLSMIGAFGQKTKKKLKRKNTLTASVQKAIINPDSRTGTKRITIEHALLQQRR